MAIVATGIADDQPDPSRCTQAGAQKSADHGGHADTEREHRLDEEQRQPMQCRGGAGETQQIHTEAEEVQPLTPESDEIERRSTVRGHTPDAHRLQDRTTA
jgi:hypothetical protein